MKINREKANALINLPDDELWKEIIKIGKNYGFTLPDKTPSAQELKKLREIVGGNKIGLTDAMKLMNNLKRSKNDG